MSKHISSKFESQLKSLMKSILKMGSLLSQRLDTINKDISTPLDANVIRDLEEEINKLEVELDEKCVKLLAIHAPAAGDLRFVVSSSRIINDLESIGDEITRFTEEQTKFLASSAAADNPLLDDMQQLLSAIRELLQQVLRAYAAGDTSGAATSVIAERDLEAQFSRASRRLVESVMQQPQNLSSNMHTFSMLRSLERIGKCTRQVANHVIYSIHGADVRHRSRQHLRDRYLGS